MAMTAAAPVLFQERVRIVMTTTIGTSCPHRSTGQASVAGGSRGRLLWRPGGWVLPNRRRAAAESLWDYKAGPGNHPERRGPPGSNRQPMTPPRPTPLRATALNCQKIIIYMMNSVQA